MTIEFWKPQKEHTNRRT